MKKYYCAYCGTELKENRLYCSRTCFNKARIKVGKTTLSYSQTHKAARRIAFCIQHRREQCEICGSAVNIDIHHIDGDYNNNRVDNLQIVYRSCHRKIHNKTENCVICGRASKAHRLCAKHYSRLLKYGDPLHKL